MPLEKIFRHALGDDGFVLLERGEVAVAFLGGDFEADVQQLPEAGVERGVLLVVTQGVGELFPGPAVDGGGAGQLGLINVNDAGVGRAEFVHVFVGVGVYLLGDLQTVATGFGQTDEFFEPARAGGLDVQARAELGERAADGRVDGELVAAGVDAQLERGRQAVFLDGEGDDGEVVVEFFLELLHVADVVHTFVETTSELGRNGLDGNLFIGNRGEDDEQLRRRLRTVGFVHGHFGDEVGRAFGFDDVLINLARVLHGEQKLGGDLLDVVARGRERLFDLWDDDLADEFGVAVNEGLERGGVGGFADAVGDVNGEEIRVGDKAIHGFEADVVGVHMVRLFPAEGFDGGIGGGAGAFRFSADEGVFAVRFVPDGDEFRAELGGEDARLELGFALVGKTVAHAEGVFAEG